MLVQQMQLQFEMELELVVVLSALVVTLVLELELLMVLLLQLLSALLKVLLYFLLLIIITFTNISQKNPLFTFVSFFPSCCIKTWLRSWQLYPKTYGGKQVIDACRIAGNGCQLSMEGTRLKSNFHHYHPMNHPSLAARHLTKSSHIFPPIIP